MSDPQDDTTSQVSPFALFFDQPTSGGLHELASQAMTRLSEELHLEGHKRLTDEQVDLALRVIEESLRAQMMLTYPDRAFA